MPESRRGNILSDAVVIPSITGSVLRTVRDPDNRSVDLALPGAQVDQSMSASHVGPMASTLAGQGAHGGVGAGDVALAVRLAQDAGQAFGADADAGDGPARPVEGLRVGHLGMEPAIWREATYG